MVQPTKKRKENNEKFQTMPRERDRGGGITVQPMKEKRKEIEIF